MATTGTTITTSTLTDAVLSNGDTLSGTWTDTFNSTGTLIGVSGADVTLSSGSSIISTFTAASVHIGTISAGSPTLNYEIELTGTSNDLFLDFSGTSPTALATNTITATGTINGQAYTSGSPYKEFSSEQTTGGSIVSTLTSGGSITDSTVVTCFTAGTMIRTPSGDVAVETLQAGDLVLTGKGQALPVRWLGRSTIAGHFADPLRAAPIRIAAGALGEGLPASDLRVSPAHALFLDGVLVEAAALVNGTSIVREPMPAHFTYYHVELASHELLISNGALSESFVDNVERLHFDNWDAHPAPESGLAIAEMDLPRAKSARQVPASLR